MAGWLARAIGKGTCVLPCCRERAPEVPFCLGNIGDATWKVLVEHLDEQQLMDLVFTVGTYKVTCDGPSVIWSGA